MLNSKIEIWKPIKDYENLYEISNLGRVKTIKTGLIKKLAISNSGYYYISLHKKGKVQYKFIHRLIAEAFIPNLLNKPQINHIDADRKNNNISNLEWCTVSENLKHSFKIGNKKARALGQKAYNSFYSKYHNVCYRKDKQRWVVTTKLNNKRLSGKLFKTELEAAQWADELLRLNNITDRPFNFP